MDHVDSTLLEVADEMLAQDIKWSEQNHPDGTGSDADVQLAVQCRRMTQLAFDNGRGTWRHVLLEEVYEALAEENPELLRKELIQVAAVAAQWAKAIDRRTP